jgi:selenocysteine lyase/cysteine desulfurase
MQQASEQRPHVPELGKNGRFPRLRASRRDVDGSLHAAAIISDVRGTRLRLGFYHTAEDVERLIE